MFRRLALFPHRLSLAAVGCLALATSAIAEDNPGDASDQRMDALRACLAEQSDASRLACYDRAARAIVAATDSGDLRVVNRAEVRETRRKLFGFSLPDFSLFKDKGTRDEEKIENLTTSISAVRRADSRTPGWLLTTAEGAVWELTNVPRRMMTPKVGQPMEIRSASLSSYFVRVNGQPGVKASRVR
jgi:hypothetical protein